MLRNYRKWECSNKNDSPGCGTTFLARAEQVAEGQMGLVSSGFEKSVWCPKCHQKPTFGNQMIQLPEEVEQLPITKYENHQVKFYDLMAFLAKLRMLREVNRSGEKDVAWLLLDYVAEKTV